MNLHFGAKLQDSGADLHQFETDRIKLCFGKLGLFQVHASEGMHQDIGHTVQKKSELVGLKSTA